MIWAVVFLAAAGAGLIQSVTGFGAAVMMMLVLPYFFDMIRSPALSSSISLGLSAVLVWRFRKYVDWKLTLPVALAYVTLSTADAALTAACEGVNLAEVCIVSPCTWEEAEEGAEVGTGVNYPALTIGVSEAKGTKCPRCWMHSQQANAEGLCPRCAAVIAKLEVEL